jgi:hypothetical protein
MATVTPNFNWPVPTSTDLVKDGATAIEALGDSIDASLVDLKGGTTGQVLSKNSNTDMDFTWVTDAAGDIQGVTVTSPLTGGGTSGTVTVGILSGTTSNLGAVQLSDSTSSTSTTLAATANAVKQAYDPAFTNNFYSGKNKIINGDFGIWQRGTSFSNIFGVFTADRYISGYGSGGTQSIAQQDVTGATGLPNQIRYAMRYSTTSAATTQYNVTQRIEDVQTLAGQTVTFSFYARRVSGTGTTLRLNAYQIFGTGGSTFTQPATDIDFTVTNSDFQRFSYSFTMPSMAGKTIGTSSYLDFRLAYPTAVSVYDVTGWQLEAGATATPFQTASGTLQGELALCQRYFNRFSSTDNAYNNFSTGNVRQTGAGAASYFNFFFPVQMRIAPTAVTLTNITSCRIQQGGTDSTVTGGLFDGATTKNGTIIAQATISTAGTGTLAANNSTAVTIDWSAEL